MSNRIELNDKELNAVNGGQITYTWDGNSGTLGKNGNNPYILLDKDAFLEYYDKVWQTTSEKNIMAYLLANNIIKLPEKND